MGGIETAITAFPVGRTPEVMIIEFDGAIEELEQLAEVCSASTSVIVIGSINDVVLYRKLIAIGIADYLFKPLADGILVNALARIFTGRRVGSGGTVCSVFSAGGGTGSSSLAQNFAIALAKSNDLKICLIDLDLAMGTTVLNFNITPLRSFRDLLSPLQEVNIAEIEQTAIEHKSGVSILASIPGLQDYSIPNTDRVGHILELARSIWDYIIVDLPPGWSELHANMFAKSEMAIIVANPNLASYQSTSILMNMQENLRKTLTRPQVVVNRISKSSTEVVKANDFLRISGGLPIHQFKEHDTLFEKASEEGKVAMELSIASELERSFSSLVAKLTGKLQIEPENVKKSWKLALKRT
jgi:pilus assembly protein CpaE